MRTVYRYRFLADLHSQGGTGFGSNQSPRVENLASSSACASRSLSGAYSRYHQHLHDRGNFPHVGDGDFFDSDQVLGIEGLGHDAPAV